MATRKKDAETTGKLDVKATQADVAERASQIRTAVAKHRAEAAAAPGGIHGRPAVLLDPMFYPEHNKRTESAKYKQTHEDLTKKKDLPCLVCGVRFSTLGDESNNRYGARAMETHHHIIEWALANAIDADLFNAALLPNLRHKHSNDPQYDLKDAHGKQRGMTDAEVADWVDHSPDNLWVLCDIHHRHKWVGIHHISYPMWAPQDLLKQEFVEQVQTAIDDWEKNNAALAKQAGTDAPT